MKKKDILNGMSEEEFYRLYPTEEAYKMAKGGSLSGAPHNGQPTANQFFDFGYMPQQPVGFYQDGGIPYDKSIVPLNNAQDSVNYATAYTDAKANRLNQVDQFGNSGYESGLLKSGNQMSKEHADWAKGLNNPIGAGIYQSQQSNRDEHNSKMNLSNDEVIEMAKFAKAVAGDNNSYDSGRFNRYAERLKRLSPADRARVQKATEYKFGGYMQDGGLTKYQGDVNGSQVPSPPPLYGWGTKREQQPSSYYTTPMSELYPTVTPPPNDSTTAEDYGGMMPETRQQIRDAHRAGEMKNMNKWMYDMKLANDTTNTEYYLHPQLGEIVSVPMGHSKENIDAARAMAQRQYGGEQFGGIADKDQYMMQEGGYHQMPDGTMMTDSEMSGNASTSQSQMFGGGDDYSKGVADTFLKAIQKNMGKNMLKEAQGVAENQFVENYAQMGMAMQDYGYNPNMNFQNMYADKADYLRGQGQQAMNNMYGATMDLEATKNPYMQYDVVPKAQKGAFTNANTNQVNTNQGYRDPYSGWDGTGSMPWITSSNAPSRSDASGKTHWSDTDYRDEYYRRNAIPTPTNQYNPQPGYGYGNQQGYAGFPGNYNPGYRWRTQGMEMPIPYNPNNTYLTHLDAKKRFFGPGARRIQMDFRTYGQPGSNTPGTKGKGFNFEDRDWQQSMIQENYKKPNKRRVNEYDAEVEALNQQYGLGAGSAKQPAAKRPNYPFAPQDTSGVPYLNPQRPNGSQGYPFAPQMQNGGGYSMAQDPDQYMNDMDGNYQDWSMIGKYKQGYDPESAANAMLAGTAGLTAMFNAKDRMNADRRMQELTSADNVFGAVPGNAIGNMGHWTGTGMGTGMFDQGNMVPIQQPGYMGKYGGQYQEGGEYEMDENEIQEFLKCGGQIKYMD